MPQQLIFTSAVRGIAPGSSGYCTVARTQDMREGLIARLEQLSVFQHVANGTHPVVLSHRIVNLRNSTFHVLSRIADAGLDYTNRTNFIAHHVVFQPHEIHGGCSPADFLLHWQGWKSEWVDAPSWTNDTSANPHLISQRIILPAKNWEGWTGRPGNAALLFATGGTPREASLIVDPGQESALIYLFGESLILASPPGDSDASWWDVSFTTFIQGKDESADFKWRGGWDGLAPQSSRNSTQVFDLRALETLPKPTNPLAIWAATGIPPAPSARPQNRESASEERLAVDEPSRGDRPGIPRPSVKQTPPRAEQRTANPRQVEETIEDSWIWRWKWMLIVVLALLAAAGGASVSLLKSRLQSIEASESSSVPQPIARSSSSEFSSSDSEGKEAAQGTASTPTIFKESAPVKPKVGPGLSPSTLPSKDALTFQSGTSSKPKDEITKPESNFAPTSAPKPSQDVMNDQAISDLPKDKTYILLKNSANPSDFKLPNELSEQIIKWKAAADRHVSIAKLGTQGLIENPTRDGTAADPNALFNLKVKSENPAGDPSFITFFRDSAHIDPAISSNSYKIHFTNSEGSLVLELVDPTQLEKTSISRRLLQASPTQVTVCQQLRDYLAHWHALTSDGVPVPIVLCLSSVKNSAASDPLTINWQTDVTAAQSKISSDRADESQLQNQLKLKPALDKITKLSFANDVQAPLNLKSSDSQSMATFLHSSSSQGDNKTPLVVLYAKKVIHDLNRVDDQDPQISGIDISGTDPKSWSASILSVPQALEKQYATSGDNGAFANAIRTFSTAWTAQFKDLGDPNIWSINLDQSTAITSAQARLGKVQSAEQQDLMNLQVLQSPKIDDATLSLQIANSPAIFVFDKDHVSNIAQIGGAAGK